jgi:hypothetical protein
MAITYDTLGSTVTINPVGAVAAQQLNTEVAIVGGYDSANADGSVTAGEATVVYSAGEAASMFGADSELAYQTALAISMGATAVHGIPVAETSETENFGSSSATDSGTLSADPQDPRVHPDEDITAQDVTEGQSVTVNIVDASPPSNPSSSNEMNLNPDTGEWAADDTSEYDISFTSGDYAEAIDTASQRVVRYAAICAERDSIATEAQTELEQEASNFRFGRAVIGSKVAIDPTATASYTPAVEDWRVVEIAPARATDADDNAVRTVGALAGLLAYQPIDVTGSITYDSVSNAFNSLNTKFSPSQAESFTQVTAITDNYEIAQGVTTSAESAFRDIYAVEIIDYAVEQLYERVKDYRGGSNAQDARRVFGSRLKRALDLMSAPAAQPPLLATGVGGQPYTVSVSRGDTDFEADVNIGIEVAPIAKEVDLDLDVGPIEFVGASVAE